MASKTDKLTVALAELTRDKTDIAGVKAANLGELMRAGFPVPEGFAITTAAFDSFVAANTLTASSSPQEVANGALPAELIEAVSSQAAHLGDCSLAVRSSGLEEDLGEASYAGQYETVLGVQGAEALIEAVRKCWASAFNRRVGKYRAEKGHTGVSRLAVLVQRLIQPQAAGVAFTANPVTGDRGEVVVSAVRGLGERLVSGEAVPDEWVVKGDEATCRQSPEQAIDGAQAVLVAELARNTEAHFGSPQDVEWAVVGETLFLLQSRPITAMPQKPDLEVPGEGFWVKDSAHFPSPVTPFGASVYLPAMEKALASMCEEFGLLLEGIQNRAIGGEVYARPVPLGGKDRSAPPSLIFFLLVRLLPAIRQRLRVARKALRSDLVEHLSKRWHDEWRPQFSSKGRELLGRNLADLDDEALAAHLDQAIDFMSRGQVVHMRLRVPYVLALYQFTMFCEDHLGRGEVEAMSLLSGTSEFSSEPGARLAELADRIRAFPQALKLFTETSPNTTARLRTVAPDIAEAFESYVNTFGHRPVGYEPGSPTLAERSELFVKLLRDRLRGSQSGAKPGPVPSRTDAFEHIRSELAERSQADLREFDRLLSAAERAYPIREDDIYYTDNVPAALVRYGALEIGRRLTASGRLGNAEDAIYLTVSELKAALKETAGSMAPLVQRRKAERAWVSAHPGPVSYGKDPGPPPDPNLLPEPLREATKAQFWYLNLEMNGKAKGGDDEIMGVPGSPGRHTGPVCIVRNESEFARLAPGNVLVCPTTTPAWSVLFSHAGAIVADGGGVLSHAAIIAREHGVPAVLGTRTGTQRLRDGQTVMVDGGTGIVLIVS